MQALVVFDPVKAQIAEYKAENADLVFDCADVQGNKDARSHIYKLRQVKTKIADVHKLAKADALQRCRDVDAYKNSLVAEVEEMIEVHHKPIRAIEAQQAAIAADKERRIREAKEAEDAKRQAELEAREKAVKDAEDKLRAERDAKEATERAKREEIHRAQREKEIAEKAKQEAEQKAKQDLINAENKRLTDIEAERQKAKAEADAKELAARREKQADEEAAGVLAAQEQERINDEAHRKIIHSEIHQAVKRIEAVSMTSNLARIIVQHIVEGKIPHVSINY